MDPNLFHIDWEQTAEVLVVIIVLSFVIERALALLFEHRAFVKRFSGTGIKEPIAFALALLICVYWNLDLPAVLLTAERTSLLGEIITAGVLAGGSKASIKLFHDVMGVKSTAAKQKEIEKSDHSSAA